MGRKVKRWEIDPNDPRPVDELLKDENAIVEEIEEKSSEDDETESKLIEEKEKFIFIRERFQFVYVFIWFHMFDVFGSFIINPIRVQVFPTGHLP